MQTKRPSARYAPCNKSRDTHGSARAGASAGARDATELDDADPGAAWLEHVDGGTSDTPEQRRAFEAAYSAAYAAAYALTGQEVSRAV